MEMKNRIILELRNRAPEKVRGGGAAGRAPAPARPGLGRLRPGGPGGAAESGSSVAQEPRGARAEAAAPERRDPRSPPASRQLPAAGSPLAPPPKLGRGARAGPQPAPAVNPATPTCE